jgi:arylsulfatase A-like enzyme
VKIISAIYLSSAFLMASAAPPQDKPNIIVFYTDDHGYADLGVSGSVTDIRTPNIDTLARSGVFAKNGYSTAPQCIPSRSGMLVGRFQSRFGVEANGQSLEGFDKSTTIAERLQASGYITAQFGKWHLGPNTKIIDHGFKHVFSQAGQPTFAANITLDGKDRPMAEIPSKLYHIDGCSQAAAAIIERYKSDPFFLYIAYRAPHTPLDAPKSYTDRFPGEMPERRRQALGMISAVDDGVGLITATLKKYNLTERTLIFLIGDNGAPLKIHKVDAPLNADPGGWDGSLNTPMNGEKGMLAEGGIHVPFVVAWPGTIPSGQTYEHPITALDVAATAAALANIKTQSGDLDGTNIVPHLKGEIKTPPHETLYWRWVAQSAIREGNWKLLRGGDREYLYDLSVDIGEKNNLAAKNPEIAKRLREKLQAWGGELTPPGLTTNHMASTWNDYYDYYLEGKPITGQPGQKNKGNQPRPGRRKQEPQN